MSEGDGQMIAIVIPAYNAERTLGAVVDRIPRQLRGADVRIWVVDDGSADRTAGVVQQLQRAHRRLEYLCLPSNRGYGGAVKRGLVAAKEAGATTAVCLHADGQYAPEELVRLLEERKTRQLDLLQGSRIASGTALTGGMPLYKYLANRALTTLENSVFRLRMTDYHSGLLVYGQRVLERVDFSRLSDSFDFDLEVIASVRAAGLRVGESPIPTHYGDEVSYLNPVTYGLRVLRVVWRYSLGHYG